MSALRLACAPFADDNGQFDRIRWTAAFESGTPADIVAVKAVTGLYEGLVNQVEVLGRLYGIRNELQHASPGIEGGEVHGAVVLLTKTLGRFVRSYLDWLRGHGIDVLQPRQ